MSFENSAKGLDGAPRAFYKELAPIKEKPTYVFLDIDKTVFFGKEDNRESLALKIGLLNKAAKIFNLCFIPTTQRPASALIEKKSIFSEFSNLNWFVDGRALNAPSFCVNLEVWQP